jgi:hypothetical protein
MRCQRTFGFGTLVSTLTQRNNVPILVSFLENYIALRRCARLLRRSRNTGCKSDKIDHSSSHPSAYLRTTPQVTRTPHIYEHHSGFVGSPLHIVMSGCTLRFARDSPLRTTLVDQVTGLAKYQIDTPIRLVGSATRIRKFESPTQPPLHWEDDADSDPGDDNDIADVKKRRSGSTGSRSYKEKGEEAEEAEPELAETSDEIARIYWKWFSSDRIIFRGGIHRRSKFLPKCGKMGG